MSMHIWERPRQIGCSWEKQVSPLSSRLTRRPWVPASATYNRDHYAALGRRLTSLPERLAALHAARIDVQAVSATPIARPGMEQRSPTATSAK